MLEEVLLEQMVKTIVQELLPTVVPVVAVHLVEMVEPVTLVVQMELWGLAE